MVFEDCLMMVNKRGVSKTAFAELENDAVQPARWTSQYGSVTFNQLGCDIPYSGMNEAGLVVTLMSLLETKFPAPDKRPSITMAQWVQYQLDNCRTVKEVISSDVLLRISAKSDAVFKSHYFICDASGDSAVIEFLEGRLVYHQGSTMPVKVLTNTTYAKALECLQKTHCPQGVSNLGRTVDRFISAAKMLDVAAIADPKSAVDYAFDILHTVGFFESEVVDGILIKQLVVTEWSIVYDLKNLRINFRTFENQKNRYVDLSAFDFACRTPVLVLNIQQDLSGNVSGNFIEYTQQINRNLIGNSFKQHPNWSNVPIEALDRVSQYPESFVCSE